MEHATEGSYMQSSFQFSLFPQDFLHATDTLPDHGVAVGYLLSSVFRPCRDAPLVKQGPVRIKTSDLYRRASDDD